MTEQNPFSFLRPCLKEWMAELFNFWTVQAKTLKVVVENSNILVIVFYFIDSFRDTANDKLWYSISLIKLFIWSNRTIKRVEPIKKFAMKFLNHIVTICKSFKQRHGFPIFLCFSKQFFFVQWLSRLFPMTSTDLVNWTLNSEVLNNF